MIDTKLFVELAVENGWYETHYDGCEREHLPCAVLYLAGALDAAQKRLDEYAVEIARLKTENADMRAWIPRSMIEDWEGSEALVSLRDSEDVQL